MIKASLGCTERRDPVKQITVNKPHKPNPGKPKQQMLFLFHREGAGNQVRQSPDELSIPSYFRDLEHQFPSQGSLGDWSLLPPSLTLYTVWVIVPWGSPCRAWPAFGWLHLPWLCPQYLQAELAWGPVPGGGANGVEECP